MCAIVCTYKRLWNVRECHITTNECEVTIESMKVISQKEKTAIKRGTEAASSAIKGRGRSENVLFY